MLSVNPFKQHFLGVLVWDILDHHSSALVLPSEDCMQIKLKTHLRMVPLFGHRLRSIIFNLLALNHARTPDLLLLVNWRGANSYRQAKRNRLER